MWLCPLPQPMRCRNRSIHRPEFLAAEQRHVFARDWLSAGRADTLPNPGDYLTMKIAREPIIVLRDADGQLRALSNVCRHRWIMVSSNPDAPDPYTALKDVEKLVGYLHMASYRETFRWNTNWKVLAENFMESYHLPVCHAGTIGGSVDLMRMTCPEGGPSFNHHFILKNDTIPLSLAHPSNTTLQGDQRRITWLLSIYPALLITLMPGYFWYICLSPDGPDHVNVLYSGGMSPDWCADPAAAGHLATIKMLLDDVNIEDKDCVEKVYAGICAGLSAPGPLSHLERPNLEFAQYLARMIPA